MAGTRGIATIRGEQIRAKSLRDSHFDENFKINENKIDIQWLNHKEILEATKVDVFIQINNKDVSNLSEIDLTADIGSRSIATDLQTEGVVLDQKVVIRKAGTEDTAILDADGDRVYGRLEYDAVNNKFILKFYSMVGGTETAFTMPANTSIDLKYVLRTNLSIIPVDAILNGGAGFVEGATDAKAYMNLQQLMKDLYGPSGTLDNDGNANLVKSVVQQIADEVTARQEADQAIRDDLAATTGAGMVGVITDPNYTGLNVQQVLSDLASRIKGIETGSSTEVVDTHTREANSANGYFVAKTVASLEERLVDIETVADAQFKDNATRLTKLETEDDRYAYEATGGETSVNLPSGKKAKPNTLFLSLNGALQAPGINYEEIKDVDQNIIGVNFAPQTLNVGDVVMMWWKNV